MATMVLILALLGLPGWTAPMMMQGLSEEQMGQLSQEGKRLMDRGRFAEAVPVYEKLSAALPANPGLKLNLAMALHLSGQDRRAIPYFEQVLKVQPNVLPALMLGAGSYMRTGQPAKAAPLLERALGQIPQDAQARGMLVDAYLMTERPEAALPHLKKLAAAEPANPTWWFGLGRAAEASAQGAFEKLGAVGPDTAWWLVLAADARRQEGRYTAAFTLYRAALEKMPNFAGVHASVAEIYEATKHPDWAAAERAKEPKTVACAPATAACLFRLKQYEQAFQTASAKTAEGLFWRARAANEMARAAFDRLAQLPPSVELHQFSAEAFRNQGRHAEAVREWEAALKLRPGDPQLKLELATSIYMNKDFGQALILLESLAGPMKDSPELWFMVGDARLQQQQVEESVEPLQRAVALRKDYVAARAVLGRALLQMGKAEEALPHLQAALAADADGTTHFQLSRALQQLGRTEEAAAAVKKYQELRAAASTAEVSITAPK